MSAETDLYAILSAAAGVAMLLGSGTACRIYPDALPEECQYPAVAFTRATTDPYNTIHGTRYGADVTMQIACWAATRAAADAVADAVADAMEAAGLLYDTRAGAIDPEAGYFATTLEVRIVELT